MSSTTIEIASRFGSPPSASGAATTTRRVVIVLTVMASAVAATVGCQETASSATSGDKPKIRLQLNWLPDAQFGGYYAAQVSGEYDRAGLDVEIVVGGPNAAVLPKLAMNRAEFGLGNADQLLLARQEGADVVAVFAVMQDNPRCIMVHQSSGIDSFEKLQHLKLAMGEGNAFAQFLKSSVPLTGVRIVSYAGNIAQFIVNDQFAQQGYVFSEPIVAKQRGSDPKTLMVSELGFNPYAGIVMASRTFVEQQPELVKKFVTATKRGWQAYLKDPTGANDTIHKLNPEIDLQSLILAVDQLRPLCFCSDELESKPNDNRGTTGSISAERFGAMTDERWKSLYRQLVDLRLLNRSNQPFDPRSVYTNQFHKDEQPIE